MSGTWYRGKISCHGNIEFASGDVQAVSEFIKDSQCSLRCTRESLSAESSMAKALSPSSEGGHMKESISMGRCMVWAKESLPMVLLTKVLFLKAKSAVKA